MFNWNQIAGLLKILLGFAGGFAVSHGWVTADSLPEITAAILTIGAALWALWTNTQKSTVEKAAAIVNVAPAEQAKVGISYTDAIKPTTPTA